MGMSRGALLAQVELPLAAPIILTGVRIVVVQNIGLAAIAALIGGGGFGTLGLPRNGADGDGSCAARHASDRRPRHRRDGGVRRRDRDAGTGPDMIEVKGLTKRFGSSTAVDDLSFEVADGEVLALVGTSGCGKSTTLRMLNRLIDPTEGSVRIDGRDVMQARLEELRLDIGYVIQGVGLFPHWTVARNIATVPRLKGWDKARIDARVRELLELFQLDPAEFADKYPAQLSGGQQQRVGVARAMAGDPSVLLMDEPFGALDPVTRAHLQDEFAAIQRRRRTTAILVTHDMDEAFKLADRIAVMDAGRILQIERSEALLRSPREGFVRQFVGLDDRALRILSLHFVHEVALPPPADRWEMRGGDIVDRAIGSQGAGAEARRHAARGGVSADLGGHRPAPCRATAKRSSGRSGRRTSGASAGTAHEVGKRPRPGS